MGDLKNGFSMFLLRGESLLLLLNSCTLIVEDVGAVFSLCLFVWFFVRMPKLITNFPAFSVYFERRSWFSSRTQTN